MTHLMVSSYNSLTVSNGKRDNSVFIKKVRQFMDDKRKEKLIKEAAEMAQKSGSGGIFGMFR